MLNGINLRAKNSLSFGSIKISDDTSCEPKYISVSKNKYEILPRGGGGITVEMPREKFEKLNPDIPKVFEVIARLCKGCLNSGIQLIGDHKFDSYLANITANYGENRDSRLMGPAGGGCAEFRPSAELANSINYEINAKEKSFNGKRLVEYLEKEHLNPETIVQMLVKAFTPLK